MNIYENIKESISSSNEQYTNDIRKVFQELIKDEQEAIAGYDRALQRLASLLDDWAIDRIKEVFNHIAEEENEHIDELEALFKEVKPTFKSTN